jgi:hypothetical protein
MLDRNHPIFMLHDFLIAKQVIATCKLSAITINPF